MVHFSANHVWIPEGTCDFNSGFNKVVYNGFYIYIYTHNLPIKPFIYLWFSWFSGFTTKISPATPGLSTTTCQDAGEAADHRGLIRCATAQPGEWWRWRHRDVQILRILPRRSLKLDNISANHQKFLKNTLNSNITMENPLGLEMNGFFFIGKARIVMVHFPASQVWFAEGSPRSMKLKLDEHYMKKENHMSTICSKTTSRKIDWVYLWMYPFFLVIFPFQLFEIRFRSLKTGTRPQRPVTPIFQNVLEQPSLHPIYPVDPNSMVGKP